MQPFAIEKILPSVNDHAELRSPIADVIVANDFVAKKGSDARERIAEHRAANVTDVHRLRDVRRAKVDHDASRRRCARNTEALVLQERGRPLRDDIRAQGEINKAGTGDLRWLRNLSHIQVRDDFIRDRPRLFTALLREHERGVGLIVAETRISRRRQLAGIWQTGRGQSGRQFSREQCLESLHRGFAAV